MMKHIPSGPKCDRIFRRILSGKSRDDLGSPAITDGSKHTFSLLFDSNADAIFPYTCGKTLKLQ
jgi:hypothetical protein